jgi:dihydrofolate synthase / folylpolyglutamate synthase
VNFAEAESYLFSLGNEVETMKLGLENIRTLLAALGNPQHDYRKVQVAGTNGKGSVCAFLDSICVGAGIRTGRYTSPHLVSIRERVKIDGTDISEADFARYATTVRAKAESVVSEGGLESIPTFFEQMTTIALLAFAEAKVEVAILETGLGGRYDAITAANAEIAVITRIDLDHQEYLGDTIEKIAEEKAAILREDLSGVVIGAQYPEVMTVIRNRCNELGIKTLDEVYSPWKITPLESGKVQIETTLYTFQNFELGLKGLHQIENAQTAILAAQSLHYDEGLDIDEMQVAEGLENAIHPGRLELIDNVLLDGAHNAGGARALRAYLDEFVDKPITLVFGTMKDKDVKTIAEILWPKADKLILTRPSNSRAMTPDDLAAVTPDSCDAENVLLTESVREAMTVAKRVSDGSLIVVTGSLYLVGEVRGLLNNRVKDT